MKYLSQSACSTANSFLFISIWLSAVFLSFDDDQHDDDNDYQFDDYDDNMINMMTMMIINLMIVMTIKAPPLVSSQTSRWQLC